jgi:hypothetical protein
VSGLRDRDAAARYGVDPPRDHDQPPEYAPMRYPAGERLSMDPHRCDADGWGRCEGLAFVPHDTGTPSKFRWWHRCRVCNTLLEASSREALERKWRKHGDES